MGGLGIVQKGGLELVALDELAQILSARELWSESCIQRRESGSIR